MLKYELKKAFYNRTFLFSFLFCLLIAICNAFIEISEYHNMLALMNESGKIDYELHSLAVNWLGHSQHFTMYLYYFSIFLVCTFPYSYSLLEEKKSTYINQIITRDKRESYYIGKYIATFLASGAVVTIPLVVNLLVCATMIPYYQVSQYGELYYGVPQPYLFSSIFYSNTILYIVLYLCLTFVFIGLWSTTVLSLGFYIKNKITLMISPFLGLLALQFFYNSIGAGILKGYTITPLFLIRLRSDVSYGAYNSIEVTLIWFIVMIAFNIITYFLKGGNSDVI